MVGAVGLGVDVAPLLVGVSLTAVLFDALFGVWVLDALDLLTIAFVFGV